MRCGIAPPPSARRRDLILGAMITNEYNQAESGLVSSKHFFKKRFMVFLIPEILEKFSGPGTYFELIGHI